MIKLALSNLWNRRGSYGFLPVELIAVAMLGWFVVDRLVVLAYQYNQPLGYDHHLLCLIETEEMQKFETGYNPVAPDGKESFMRLLANIRTLPEVDKATPVTSAIMEQNSKFNMGRSTDDGKWMWHRETVYFPGEDFFTVFGIKGPDGEEISEYLSDLSGYGMIEPQASVRFRKPEGDPFAKNDSLLLIYEEKQKKMPPGMYIDSERPLLGMTWLVRSSSVSPNILTLFKTPFPGQVGSGVVVRLRPEVDREKFVLDMLDRLADFREGNLRISSVRSYAQMSEQLQNRESGAERRLDKIFALFFLINVCLGVIGTFWMMTRKRAPEVGVLRAFGFSTAKVRALLFSEAAILTLFAWFAGCALYLVYALKHGLCMGYIDDETYIFQHSWVESFPQHFAIVSVVILLLLMVAVLIGVAGPGWKLSRVNPVDALRDE